MKQQYILNIENPCQKAQWATMTETETGKFCAQCATNVVDFAKLTDVEIIKFLENNQGKICGNLTSSQMNRLMVIKQKGGNPQLKRILASLLLLGATESCFATVNTFSKPQIVITPNAVKLKEEVSIINLIAEPDSLKKIISGRVIEEYDANKAVVLTSVFVKNTKISAKTDSAGYFKIELPNGFAADTVILVVKHSGWESDTEIHVFKKDLPISNLIIKKQSPMLGEISIKVRRKWWQFWKKKFY